MKGILIFLLSCSTLAWAQTPQVPGRMEFGGIRLLIDEPARREIQESVNALTANPKYFNVHVQRARSYFPIIERIFAEEKIPEDFKYLVLQESALLPDAVSSSDAVGFWQFKDFTAMEMGLRIDRSVDERMNIVSSSRAAARYLNKNNTRFFDNWIITLMAYQMGPGAAIKAGGEKHKGKKTMNIDRRTYWYIKKFLAHKVAFEHYVDGPAEVNLVELNDQRGKSLDDIARETGNSSEDLKNYNKWLKKGRIPDDRSYTVLLPVTAGEQPMVMAGKPADEVVRTASVSHSPQKVSTLSRNYDIADPGAFPDYANKSLAVQGRITRINDRPAVIARVNDRVATLAGRGGISVSKFLRINDMDPGQKVVEGQVYYLKNKRSKPKAYYHVVAEGEDLWEIAQKYGMKVGKLMQRNRIRANSFSVEKGRILWLRYIRPSDVPVEFKLSPEKKQYRPVVAREEPDRTVPEQTSGTPVPEKVTEKIVTPPVRESDSDTAVEKREWGSAGGGNEVTETITSDSAQQAEDKVSETAHRRIIHRVRSGETLYSVSRQYDISVRELLEWNSLSIHDPISIGQELIVLKPVTSGETTQENEKEDTAVESWYVVKSGDTLYGIARKFNLSVSELKKLNNKAGDTINPGEKLKVGR